MSEIEKANAVWIESTGKYLDKIIESGRVKEIVTTFLIQNKYDGLFCPGECACKISDLMCCGEYCGECLPGYLHPGDGEEVEFFIKATKERKK